MAGGITLRKAIADSLTDECCISFTADDVYKAIANGLVTYDLWNEPLSDSARSKVYRDKATMEFARRLEVPVAVQEFERVTDRVASVQPGHSLSYDGRSYTVTLVGMNHVTLANDEGSTELPISTLQALYAKGQIAIEQPENTTLLDSTRVPFSTLSPDELTRAVKRGRALDLSADDPATSDIPERTLQRWRSLVRAAGVDPVSRNLALVGNIRKRGNRNRKLPEQVLSLIKRIAADVYNKPTSVNVSGAYKKFLNESHKSGVQPCSYRSFGLELRNHASVREREGKRAAYQSAPIVWYLIATDPIHGVRPFEYVHIDYTPLEIFLISGATKKLLGRPWLSLAIDAESRMIVGFYLSFDPPSYRSCMMVLRDIVRRHGRMPSTIVTDNGAEFRSDAFKRVCELYNTTLRYRPAGHPRHGSVMERVFGTTQSQLIHNLEGNTKQLRNVRTVTKSVSPERHAQWTLPALYGALDKYFEQIYGTREHPAHGEPPSLHLQKRLAETGLRLQRLVRLDRTFLIETCPPVDRKGERKVDSQRGVKVSHFWYWTGAFPGARLDGKSVPVRVDPWDARFCYALIGRDWHQCVCKLVTTHCRLTRIELESYFEEMRRNHGVEKCDFTPERIREWMQVLDRNAFDSRLQDQQAEARLIYDALNLTSVEPAASAPIQLSIPEFRDPAVESLVFDTDTPSVEVEAEDDYAIY